MTGLLAELAGMESPTDDRAGLQALWRDLKSLGSAVDATGREVTSKLEQFEAANDRVQSSSPQLEVALARLRGASYHVSPPP